MKYLVDIMSDLKMNHLELYVEGFSFEYKSFPQYLQENSYVTVEEYKELEEYCNKNAIRNNSFKQIKTSIIVYLFSFDKN